MRFKSLTCKNYRQFKDLHLDFTKTSNYDMHLIVASNGVGKTNLLNAINWCLYGDEPHTSGLSMRLQEDILSLEKLSIYNDQALIEAKNANEDSLPVIVTVEIEDNGYRYSIRREQNYKTTSGRQIGKDILSCTKINNLGETSFPSDSEIQEIIEHFLPQGIREYFYFDGEQLLTYFNAQKRENIKKSVAVIAQINVVNKVIEHLDKVIKEYDCEIKKNDPLIAEKAEKYQNAVKEQKEMIRLIAQIENQIRAAEKAIAEGEDSIRGQLLVVDKYNAVNANENTIEDLKKDREVLWNELITIVRKYFVLINLYQINKKTNTYINDRIAIGSLIPNFNLEDIKESIDECKCKLCGCFLDDEKIQNLKNILMQMGSNISAQKLSLIKNDVCRALEIDNYETEKQNKFDAIFEKDKQIKLLEEKNNELYSFISAYKTSDIDNVNNILEQLKKNRILKDSNIEKKGTYQGRLIELTDKVNSCKESYDNAIERNKTNEQLTKRRIFAAKARDIVSSISEELAGKVREDIAKHTSEIFKRLVWKKDFYGNTELDEDYNIKLYNKYNKSCLGSCSAAETELLALAFTLAIHLVSGYNSFLFIDTPVGRVSDFNRKNFAEVLLEVSENKQIILAFTPSEYSKEISDVLSDDVVSSFNELVFKGNGNTEVNNNGR